MPYSPRAWRLSCVFLAATVLAGGCGSSRENPGPAASPTATVGATPGSVEPTPTPSPTVPPAPSPVTAADGTNHRACADGTCEVAVSRPGTIRLGGRAGSGSTLVVREVLDDGLDFDLTLARGGGGSGTLKFKDSCGTIVRFDRSGGGGSGSFCNADGSVLPAPEPQAGVVALQVPGKTSDGAIVLRIVSG
ncbi:hypothetical protein AB0J86_00465 [Micromonospora sp. NPDC049559]|uniref:hypothetical protein n=1 Tax=Micromonospora sp. NPDC049559 TaxID=3155923 RepID=UPI003448DD82